MIALCKGRQKLVVCFCLLLALNACKDKSLKPSEAAASAKPKTAPTVSETADAKKGLLAPETTPLLQTKFVYVVEGRRDPFQPLVLVSRPIDQGEQGLITPLQQFDTQQFKLVAIIIGYGEPMAMLSAPDGKNYILRKGTRVGKNGGKVIRISIDAVQIEEIYKDLTDKLLENIVEIKLPKREGV